MWSCIHSHYNSDYLTVGDANALMTRRLGAISILTATSTAAFVLIMPENTLELFRPQEIVYIQADEFRLFAQVIQTIPTRNRCWVKPLAIAHCSDFQFKLLHDLQDCAQLILPLYLFHAAMDTEVIPVMMELFQLEKIADRSLNTTSLSRQALHQFIANLAIDRIVDSWQLTVDSEKVLHLGKLQVKHLFKSVKC